jgi:hypothetical protein
MAERAVLLMWTHCVVLPATGSTRVMTLYPHAGQSTRAGLWWRDARGMPGGW